MQVQRHIYTWYNDDVIKNQCVIQYIYNTRTIHTIQWNNCCSVEDMKGGYMQALAMVKHNGSVFWPPIVKFNGACEIKIKYFPFDDQVSVYTYTITLTL